MLYFFVEADKGKENRKPSLTLKFLSDPKNRKQHEEDSKKVIEELETQCLEKFNQILFHNNKPRRLNQNELYSENEKEFLYRIYYVLINIRFNYTKALLDLKKDLEKNEFSEEFKNYVNSKFISIRATPYRKNYKHNKLYWYFSFAELLIKKRENVVKFLDSFNSEIEKYNRKNEQELKVITRDETIETIWKTFQVLKMGDDIYTIEDLEQNLPKKSK